MAEEGQLDQRVQEKPHKEFVSALASGLKCLETMISARQPMTISEVAQKTGYARATSRRMMLTMRDLGFLLQDGRHFALTPQVSRLGIARHAVPEFWQLAHHRLEMLVQEVRETVVVTLRDGFDAHYVARLDAPRPLRLSISAGDRFPLHTVSTGRMLLAQAGPEYWSGYLDAVALTQRTKFSITDKAVMERALTETKERGYAVVLGEYEESIGGVSMMITDALLGPLGAVGISFSLARHPRKDIEKLLLPALEDSASDIELMLAGKLEADG